MPVSASRREFIKNTGKLAAVSALANVAIPAVHAAGSDQIQVALIGCGGRGGGAAANALSVKRGPVKLVAMADIFPDRLEKDLTKLQAQFASQVDVPPERAVHRVRRLPEGDGLLETGRHRHLRHAAGISLGAFHFRCTIQKRLNVFMEKPLTADGTTSKRMFSLGRRPRPEPEGGCGVDVAPHRAMQELAERVTMATLAVSIARARVTGCTGRGDISARYRNRPESPTCFTRCSASTVSSGQAGAASTTSTST